jgi:predicted phage terminase large subunit-like protein
MLLEMQEKTKELGEDERYKVRHLCWPAVLGEGVDVRPEECEAYYKDGLFDPVRLSRRVLNEARLQGEYMFQGQFLQKPAPPGGSMFHVERIVIDTPPSSWKMRIRSWDKAGTKDSGAYSVGVLLGVDNKDRYWVLDVVRGQWDSNTREDVIKQTAMTDGKQVVVVIEQEPGSGGKESAEGTARNLGGWTVKLVKPSGDKAQRADPFSTQVNAGNVFMAKGSWNKAYLDELRYFSLENSKYKDQVDASSNGFNVMTKKRYVGGFFQLRKKGLV